MNSQINHTRMIFYFTGIVLRFVSNKNFSGVAEKYILLYGEEVEDDGEFKDSCGGR